MKVGDGSRRLCRVPGTFVNRLDELAALNRWWSLDGSRLGLIWGRRRVGKSALVEKFVSDKRAIVHIAAGRPMADELRLLSAAAASVIDGGLRDLNARPFVDLEDALETLAAAAADEPLVIVLDEVPELIAVAPDFESRFRAFWDRARRRTRLRVLLLGSAVRVMERLQEERGPLFGRIDLALLVHPFLPHEAALMLPRLAPADRALVWGLLGGLPRNLELWDQELTIVANLERLIAAPGAPLLTAGELAMTAELGGADLSRRIVYAVANGRSRFAEIRQAVQTDPTRALESLVRLRILERVVPVTASERRTRTVLWRLADNFLAFWLGVVDRYRGEIERGLGASIVPVLVRDLDRHMGARFEAAFRDHLRLMAARGAFGEGVVAVGPFWADQPRPVEIDAVALAGSDRVAVLVGEARWSRREDARRIRRDLDVKAQRLPRRGPRILTAACARERLVHAREVDFALTAADLFAVE